MSVTLKEKQRQAALKRANGVRTAKKELKEKVRAGKVTLRELMLAEDSYPGLDQTRVDELLICVPRIGKQKIARILQMSLIHSPSMRFSSLGKEARRRILRAAAEAAPSLPGGGADA